MSPYMQTTKYFAIHLLKNIYFKLLTETITYFPSHILFYLTLK